MSISSSIGLIAGAGRLPLEFVRSPRHSQDRIVAALIKGAAPTVLEKRLPGCLWISVGQLGSLISFFKKQGVRRAVMLGKVQHSSALKDPRLDWRAIHLLARLKDRSGETILKGIGEELKKDGIDLMDSRKALTHLLAKENESVGRPGASEALEWGLRKARILAREGIGQTLLVKKGAVVAVEGAEGTDEAIRRAGRWGGKGAVLFKVASPHQDWRFDVPAVGPATLQALSRSKAAGMVIEAGKCFLLEKERTLALARQRGLFIRIV
ncbi:MAG TPA: UDP-2,3-diacylglucosamine diphosphatase LpxI [bacterium]|nr:UDP-2,3-diacylglucosamine diphosphatase LpxI [bacterium]